MKYHKSLGFPKTIVFPTGYLNLIYSKHAINKIGLSALEWDLQRLKIKKENIIEIRTKDNVKCTSILLRIRYDYHRDITLSLKPSVKKAVVITLWINNKNDNHKTLDQSKYDIPDNNNSKELDEIYAGK